MAFQAPNGFFLVNGTRSVSISGQSGKGEFAAASLAGDMDAYINAAFAGLTEQGQQQVRPSAIQRTTVNGIPAAYGMARVQQSAGSSTSSSSPTNSARPGVPLHHHRQGRQAKVFDPMFQSLRRLPDSEAAAVKPRKLEVVTVKAGDTLQSLAQRMAYGDAPLDRFLVLNGLAASSQLSAGQKVKIVDLLKMRLRRSAAGPRECQTHKQKGRRVASPPFRFA